jgi:hypothetical protein
VTDIVEIKPLTLQLRRQYIERMEIAASLEGVEGAEDRWWDLNSWLRGMEQMYPELVGDAS